MVDAIVILHAAYCVVAYCSSMLFMYCMQFLSTTMKFLARANKVCHIISYQYVINIRTVIKIS